MKYQSLYHSIMKNHQEVYKAKELHTHTLKTAFFVACTCAFFFSNFKLFISESEVTQSCPTLATPWTVAHQVPPSMGFSRQEYWSGLPFPSPGDLPNIRLPLFPNQRTEPEQDFTSLPLAKEMSASHRDVCCCC